MTSNREEHEEKELLEMADACIRLATEKGMHIAVAESCTGGLLAAFLTEGRGASSAFDRGYVTYTNEAKNEMLGVPTELLEKHGAVSEEVAHAMAEGAVERSSKADIAVAITGIAGPTGGSREKPVGTVHIAAHLRGGGTVHVEERFGDQGRAKVRLLSVETAIRLLADLME